MLGNWEKSDLNILQHVFSSIHGKVFMKTVLACYHSFISHLILGKPTYANSAVFFNIVQKGGGIKPMFKNFVANILLF